MKPTEITVQVRVTDESGFAFYEKLLGRPPEFVPHEGFAEWELVPKAWLQVAVGEPTAGNGPVRLGVADIEAERERIQSELQLDVGELYAREGVPVKWCTFEDPWGNRIGLFEEREEE